MNIYFHSTSEEASERKSFVKSVALDENSMLPTVQDDEYETADLAVIFLKSLRTLSLEPGLHDKISNACMNYRDELGNIEMSRGPGVPLRALVSDTFSLMCSYPDRPDSAKHITSDLQDFSKYASSMFKDFRVDNAFANGDSKRAVKDVVSNVIKLSGVHRFPETVTSALISVGEKSLNEMHHINEIKPEISAPSVSRKLETKATNRSSKMKMHSNETSFRTQAPQPTMSRAK